MKRTPLTPAEARAVTDRLRAVLGSKEYVIAATAGSTERQPSTYTYFIQMDEHDESPGERLGPGGPIKIGCAADPEARLLQLQTAVPHPLRLMGYVPGGVKLERELHKKYAHLHMRGEWFRATLEFEGELYEMIFDYEDGQR